MTAFLDPRMWPGDKALQAGRDRRQLPHDRRPPGRQSNAVRSGPDFCTSRPWASPSSWGVHDFAGDFRFIAPSTEVDHHRAAAARRSDTSQPTTCNAALRLATASARTAAAIGCGCPRFHPSYCGRSTSNSSSCPDSSAMLTGVVPSWSLAWMSAPRAVRIVATSIAPSMAAACSGVRPSWSRA